MNIIETNLDFKKLTYTNKLTAIILHHAAHSTCSVYDIHKWHKRDKGWSGIGYHFFITKDGKVHRGRPEKAVGANCLNHNAYSIGICVQGDYMKESMPIAQETAIIELCKYLCDKYKIETIKGHKELNPTSCPGINYPLERIKEEVLCKEKEIDTYTVKSGDTLWSIAKKFGISVDELKNLNKLNTDKIYPNQVLRVI